MLEKATLVGLLGFLFPGKLAQASVGLLISTVFLLCFSSTMPYNDRRTNNLAIISQSIKVFSYFSTILLKVDLQGEVMTPHGIALFMLGVNIPMAAYFAFDVIGTIKDDLTTLTHLGDDLHDGGAATDQKAQKHAGSKGTRKNAKKRAKKGTKKTKGKAPVVVEEQANPTYVGAEDEHLGDDLHDDGAATDQKAQSAKKGSKKTKGKDSLEVEEQANPTFAGAEDEDDSGE